MHQFADKIFNKMVEQNAGEIFNIIRQLNVLQYNTLNSTLTYYFEIHQVISQ